MMRIIKTEKRKITQMLKNEQERNFIMNIFKKLIAGVMACCVVAAVSISASATSYFPSTIVSSGGSGGKISTYNYVFRETTQPPSSGVSIYSSGVRGNIPGGLQITNWQGSGHLYTTTSTTPISGTANNASEFEMKSKGQGSAYNYTVFSLTLKTNSTTFGTTSYERNGAF